MKRLFLVLGLIACGCNDETRIEHAEFAELCGQRAPVQLLALDPERSISSSGEYGPYDGRQVFSVTHKNEHGNPYERELWSVGLCGEDPLLLFRETDYRMKSHLWPDHLLACDEQTGEIMVLDPSGARAPQMVFQTLECSARSTEEGLLTILPSADHYRDELVLQPWPADPWAGPAEQILLFDAVSLIADAADAVRVTESDFLVLSSDFEIVAISRSDGQATVLASDVGVWWEHSSDGRYIAWYEQYDGGYGVPYPFLLDRATNEITQLDGALYPWTFLLEQLGMLIGPPDGEQQRLLRLPSLESLALPAMISPIAPIDDHRSLVSTELEQFGAWFGPYAILDVSRSPAVLEPISVGPGTYRPLDDDSFALLAAVPCCLDEYEQGKLWRVPYDGEPELLARRATRSWSLLPDGRVLTLVDVDEDEAGTLVVVDPVTLAEQRIDAPVRRSSIRTSDTPTGDPLVIYAVVDRDRYGLWAVRLAR